MRAYLQRVAGYCATALTTEQVMFLWHGAGANGKSVAQAVLAHVLGAYAQTMPVSTLMASSVDDRIPNDVARMAGRRFMIASETKQGKSLDEQRMKALTGGDSIAARYMRAEWFEFKPVGKIQLTTNHLPRMSDDAATWRRIHLIPWPVVIPEAERDGGLQQNLIEQESPGILNWIIAGALAWGETGLEAPQGVLTAKEEYRVEEDIVGQFIAEMLDVVEPKNGVSGRDSAAIFSAYELWARTEGHKQEARLPRRALTSRIQKHRFEYVRSNGWSGFPGLQVRPML
jgi:putative DNA primase/helicase